MPLLIFIEIFVNYPHLPPALLGSDFIERLCKVRKQIA